MPQLCAHHLVPCLFPIFRSGYSRDSRRFEDAFPLTLGSPDFESNVYSGISLTINSGAPADLRFNTGQAAWLGIADTTIVDTELEQSVFTLDPSVGLSLEQSSGLQHLRGLLIGDLIPAQYYGPFPNISGNSLNPHIDFTYRLTGSAEIVQGRFESFDFVPEPNAIFILALGGVSLLGFRKRRRRTASKHDFRQLRNVPRVRSPAWTCRSLNSRNRLTNSWTESPSMDSSLASRPARRSSFCRS